MPAAAFLIAAAIAVPHPQHGPSNPSPPHHAASSAPISSSTAGKVSNVTSTHEKLASLVRAVQLIKDHLGVGHDLFDIANSRSGDSASLRSLKGSDVAAMSQQSQQQTYQETLDDATKMGVSPQGSATSGVDGLTSPAAALLAELDTLTRELLADPDLKTLATLKGHDSTPTKAETMQPPRIQRCKTWRVRRLNA